MAAFDIVSLGEPMCEFSQIPGEAKRYLQGYGGDTSNCAIAAARSGARVAYVTRLGDDEFGRQFLDLWRGEGVNTSHVAIDAQAHTAVYFITHGTTGHSFSYLRQGSAASKLSATDVPTEVVRRAKFFHSSGITQAISSSACDAVFAGIEGARQGATKVAFDANYRPRLWPIARARAVLRATAALSDYFLLSEEDAAAMFGEMAPETMLAACHQLGAKHVILKLGGQGVLASDAKRQVRLAGHRVSCVDATGAGDCFAGALLARLCRDDDFETALRYANAAAALATTDFGAVAPLPKPAQVQSLLQA